MQKPAWDTAQQSSIAGWSLEISYLVEFASLKYL